LQKNLERSSCSTALVFQGSAMTHRGFDAMQPKRSQ
jgi:hypothetical protein